MRLLPLAYAAWLLGVIALPLVRVSAEERRAGTSEQETLLVFAAASTKEAVDEILKDFERSHPTIQAKGSYGSSAALAKQLEAGAEADVFLSASESWLDALDKKGLVGSRHDLLGNELVAVTPTDSKLKLATPDDLLEDDVQRLATGEPESVPAGMYAKQALTKLDLWERLKPKIVGAGDVRQALAFVETGAAEAGIVYATDAAVTKRVKIAFKFDAALTEPIFYPLALLKRSSGSTAARSLYAAFQSEQAAKVFRRHGFSVQSESSGRKP
jgi:molybdate transport system substrate-binding protein